MTEDVFTIIKSANGHARPYDYVVSPLHCAICREESEQFWLLLK